MVRKHLSAQLALGLLLVSLVPLAGTAILTLHLMERYHLERLQTHHDQLAVAASALVRDYIQDGQTKLKSIGQMIRPVEDPQAQSRKLNSLVDPPGIFLEVSTVTVRGKVIANAMTKAYADANLSNDAGNRRYDRQLRQSVNTWSADQPVIAVPAKGQPYSSEKLEIVKDFPALTLSVPAPGGNVVTGNLDFRPVKDLLATVAGVHDRQLVLSDGAGNVLAASADVDTGDFIERGQPVGHGNWKMFVRESRERALAPLREARHQAIIWFGLATLLVVGLAAFIGGRLARPIKSLASAADRLGRGDFSARTGITGDDEIGQLGQSFDRMAAAVEQLDKMKGEFVAHVSHELRTPLTSAKMALANVEEGIAGKEALPRVQEDLDRLIRMVNGLLDAAHVDAGIELAKQSTDLGALVRSSVDTLRPIARVPVEVSGTGETIDLDGARVRQILLNLVDNALKYARDRVDVKVGGREVRVTDDGPGVPEEHRERVFERFAHVESGPKPPGAGLGLSISRRLAELHGGSLVCEGNTFVLKL